MTAQQHQLKHLNLVWAAILLSWLAFTLNPAHATDTTTPAGQQTMIYEVYAGGIHALQATMVIDLSQPDLYTLNLAAKTRGLLGRLAPWEGTFDSEGWVEKDGTYQPEIHQSTGTWRGEVETKQYRYNRDGSFKELTITEHEKPSQSQEPDPALTDQTVDALTATLQIMKSVAAGQACEGTSDVFDGKRRFAKIFHEKSDDMLQASKYNIYEGPAKKCTIEVQPKGGKWYKKPRGWLSIQEQGRAKGTMPTLWVASLSEGEPAIPVKLLVKTDYGALMVHLTEYTGPKTTLMSKKRGAE